MNELMSYKLLGTTSLTELTDNVDCFASLGWALEGTLVVARMEKKFYFYQWMSKKEPKKEPKNTWVHDVLPVRP